MLELEMDKRTTGEQAADALRAEILSGRLGEGAQISQAETADCLGLSRMPVREALGLLESEGLVERLDNRHTRVIGMNEKTRASRMRLLTEMTLEALADIGDEGRAQMLTWWQTAGDDARAHEAFHSRLFELCPDMFLRQMYRRVFLGVLEYGLRCGRGEIGKGYLETALTAAGESGEKARMALIRYYAGIDKRFGEGQAL